MGDEKPTVVRIEYEYSDGTITRATGDDANSINEAIVDAFAMNQIHGGRYNGPYLKPVEPLQTGSLRCPRCGGGSLYDMESFPPVHNCGGCNYRWTEAKD